MSPRDRSYSDGSDPGVTTVCQFVHRCYPSARCGAATDSRPDGSVRSRWVRPRRNEFVSVVPQAAGRAPNSAAFGSVVDACDQVRPPQDAHCRARQPHFVAGVGREEDLVARLDPYAFRPDGGDDAGAAVGLRRGRNDQAQVRLRLLVRGLDHDEVVERLEREVDPARVVLLHLHEESYIRPAAMKGTTHADTFPPCAWAATRFRCRTPTTSASSSSASRAGTRPCSPSSTTPPRSRG